MTDIPQDIVNNIINMVPRDANQSSPTARLIKDYTDPVKGRLTQDAQGMSDTIRSMDDRAVSLQTFVDAYKSRLTAQFTAMESLVSKLNSTGNFLTQQFDSLSSSKGK